MRKLAILAGILAYYLSLPAMALEAYHNPINGRDYVGDWEVYQGQPKNLAEVQAAAKSKLTNVILLEANDTLERNVEPQETAEYINKIDSIVCKTPKNPGEGGRLIVQIQLHPLKKPDIRMTYDGKFSQKYLQTLYDKINALPPYRSKMESIKFQALFTL